MPNDPKPKQILVVDDEPRYLRLLEANLRTEGYEVVTAADGVEALEAFSARQFDLLLLDVLMPRLDGFAVCQRIRAYSNVPIMILTAKGEEQDRVKGLDLGADDYLVKPGSSRTRTCGLIWHAQRSGAGTSRYCSLPPSIGCCCNLPTMWERS